MDAESYFRAQVVVHAKEREKLEEILDGLVARGDGATVDVRVDGLPADAVPATVRSFFEMVQELDR